MSQDELHKWHTLLEYASKSKNSVVREAAKKFAVATNVVVKEGEGEER
jgi:hypothetical protein